MNIITSLELRTEGIYKGFREGIGYLYVIRESIYVFNRNGISKLV